ncbi:MAG: hypothetical protein ACLPKB_24430 [Xanthobacteraceae bacterium]
MTTERKIRANRRNAARSTGPRSPEGRARSSRNSLRHGLSAAYSIDHALAPQAERLAVLLADDATDPQRLAQARIAALAQLTVLRVRAARVTLLNQARADQTDTAPDWMALQRLLAVIQPGQGSSLPDRAGPEPIGLAYARLLPKLIRLDRYERTALARRNRALCALDRASSRATTDAYVFED